MKEEKNEWRIYETGCEPDIDGILIGGEDIYPIAIVNNTVDEKRAMEIAELIVKAPKLESRIKELEEMYVGLVEYMMLMNYHLPKSVEEKYGELLTPEK